MAKTEDSSTQKPPYWFINGNGDIGHQNAINEAAAAGYKVISMAFNEDAGQKYGLTVLMERKGNSR
jgi:hypothetical protein